MKTIKVTDRAANMIAQLRDEKHLRFFKSEICDRMCEIIGNADMNGTITNDFAMLCELASLAELYTELGNDPD